MLIKKQKISPPELTEANLRRYMANRMDFRLEQFIFEPSLEAPQGSLFKDVCQQWQLDYIYKPLDERTEEGFPKYRLLYYQLPKKPLWIKTPIITTQGWKNLEDIKEGDFIFNENGEAKKVLGTTEILYNEKCYEITFSDNTKIIASWDHAWTVWDRQALESFRSYGKNHEKVS